MTSRKIKNTLAPEGLDAEMKFFTVSWGGHSRQVILWFHAGVLQTIAIRGEGSDTPWANLDAQELCQIMDLILKENGKGHGGIDDECLAPMSTVAQRIEEIARRSKETRK